MSGVCTQFVWNLSGRCLQVLRGGLESVFWVSEVMTWVLQHFWTRNLTKYFGPKIVLGPKFIEHKLFPYPKLNSKQLKVTKVEVRYSSHMDFENGVIIKTYKS